MDACESAVREAMFSVLQRDEVKFGPVRQNALDMLDPQPGQSLLDVGSGLGGDAAEFAAKGARVLGVDASVQVVERARKQLARRPGNLTNAVSFRRVREEDVLSVFGEAKFDGVYTQRLLEHVDNPRDTISRLARIVKAGQGKIVIAEPDWGTYIIDHPNRVLAQKVQSLFSQQVANPFIGRQLRRLIREVGLTRLALRAVPVVFVDPDASGLANAIKDFVDQGLLSSSDASEFMDAVDAMRGEAAFTSSLTMFIVRAYRPAGKLKPLQPIIQVPEGTFERATPAQKTGGRWPPQRILPVPSAQMAVADAADGPHASASHEDANARELAASVDDQQAKRITSRLPLSSLPLNEMKLILQADENEGLVKLPL
jgi:2-polyprenyl-3-methyl-5-hydroxy-6-metoxy-1,4-benzoquinol methylase